MAGQWDAYLQQVGMGETLITRVNEFLDEVALVLPEKIEAIHVSEYPLSDGTHQYEKVYAFSKSFVVDPGDFLSGGGFEIDCTARRIKNLGFDRTSYGFGEATKESRLSVSYHTFDGLSSHLQASGENCTNLLS